MAVDRAALVAAFPEFTSTVTYPDAQVDFWLGQAPLNLPVSALGDRLDLATILFVAHNLVLSAQAARQAAGGGAAGSVGVVASKSIGGVSVSYDTGLTSVAGAGFYNATGYGQRLYQLLKGVTTGPLYVPGFPRNTAFNRMPY